MEPRILHQELADLEVPAARREVEQAPPLEALHSRNSNSFEISNQQKNCTLEEARERAVVAAYAQARSAVLGAMAAAVP